MYILLPGSLAVVTSAVRGTMISFPAVVDDVRCSLYSNIHPFVWLYPHHLASVSMPEHGTIPFFMSDDLCHTPPFAFKRVLYLLQL
jgi:hypothetical protein